VNGLTSEVTLPSQQLTPTWCQIVNLACTLVCVIALRVKIFVCSGLRVNGPPNSQSRYSSRWPPLWWAHTTRVWVSFLYFLLPGTQSPVFITGTQPVCYLSTTLFLKPRKHVNPAQVLDTLTILSLLLL